MNPLGPEWKYRVVINNTDWHLAQIWCELNIGEFNNTWYKLGIDPMMNLNNGTTETTWYFKHHEDAVLFALKWL